MIVRCILLLWIIALSLTFLPFFGFGLYQVASEKGTKCARYRDATDPIDIAYAYLWFTFGKISKFNKNLHEGSE